MPEDAPGGNTRFLANLLTSNYSSVNWSVKFIASSQAKVEEGIITEEEQVELLRDTLVASKVSGVTDPEKIESIDWPWLLDHLKELLKVSDKLVAIHRDDLKSSREYYQKTLGARPLRDVIDKNEFDRIVTLLESEEFDQTFRVYKLDQILGLIDWNYIHRGPIDASDLPTKLKSLLRAKSGHHIASIWLETLSLRYPNGFPDKRDT